MEYDWYVMYKQDPEPWRGPWSEGEARGWIQECLDEGYRPDVFWLGRSPKVVIERVD